MKIISFVVVGVVFVAGCSASDLFTPDQSVILSVSKIDAPPSIASGSPMPIALTVVSGGCRSFDHIEVTRDLRGANMTVWGHDSSIGRKNVACTADLRIESHSVQLEPPFANSFRIEVNQGRLAPLTAVVQVQ
jgi:hypothetical protein